MRFPAVGSFLCLGVATGDASDVPALVGFAEQVATAAIVGVGEQLHGERPPAIVLAQFGRLTEQAGVGAECRGRNLLQRFQLVLSQAHLAHVADADGEQVYVAGEVDRLVVVLHSSSSHTSWA